MKFNKDNTKGYTVIEADTVYKCRECNEETYFIDYCYWCGICSEECYNSMADRLTKFARGE